MELVVRTTASRSAPWLKRTLVRELSRAACLPHSGRTFLDHLVGTHRILTAWGLPPSVCSAGLLHSAYSTQYYPHALFALGSRHRLRLLVGVRAERLIHLFCKLDRATSWDALSEPRKGKNSTALVRDRHGNDVVLSLATLRDLVMIEAANIAEQSCDLDGGPVPWIARVTNWWSSIDHDILPLRLRHGPVSMKSDSIAIKEYRRALTGPRSRAVARLDRAIVLNPYVGEPRVLRGLYKAAGGTRGAALDLRQGLRLLNCWAVSWDRRLSLEGWRGVVQRCRTESARVTLRHVVDALSGQSRSAV